MSTTPLTDATQTWLALLIGDEHGLLSAPGSDLSRHPEAYERAELVRKDFALKLEGELREARNLLSSYDQAVVKDLEKERDAILDELRVANDKLESFRHATPISGFSFEDVEKMIDPVRNERDGLKAECDALSNLLWEHPTAPCDQNSIWENMKRVQALYHERDALRAELAPLRELVGVDSRAASAVSDIDHWKKLMDVWDENVKLRAELEIKLEALTFATGRHLDQLVLIDKLHSELASWKRSAELERLKLNVLKESRAAAVEQEQVSRNECNRIRSEVNMLKEALK